MKLRLWILKKLELFTSDHSKQTAVLANVWKLSRW